MSVAGDDWRLRIERRMQRTGRSARSLSLAIGQNPAYIQQLITGMRNKKVPSLQIMKAIADELGTSVEFLVYGEPQQEVQDEKKPGRRYTLAEILRNIGAYPVTDSAIFLEQQASAGKGKGALIPQGLEGVETVPAIAGKQLYAMRITGSCMDPELKPGDIVHFDPDREPEDGDMVVATQHGERALVKWLDKRGPVQQLLPLQGDPILVDEHIELIGVVETIVRKAPRRTDKKRVRPPAPGQQRLIDE